VDEREYRRADQPFLQAGEEVVVRTTTGVEPWIGAEVAAVVLWTAFVLELLERAFVLVIVAAAACD
jgi:hypothetical protein